MYSWDLQTRKIEMSPLPKIYNWNPCIINKLKNTCGSASYIIMIHIYTGHHQSHSMNIKYVDEYIIKEKTLDINRIESIIIPKSTYKRIYLSRYVPTDNQISL